MTYPRETLCFACFRDMFFLKICANRTRPVRKHFLIFWAPRCGVSTSRQFPFFGGVRRVFCVRCFFGKSRWSSSVDDEDVQCAKIICDPSGYQYIKYSYICNTSRAGWVGWGGIIINVVVALKCVTRCGCFEVTCHARAVWVWGGVGGVGRDNYKRCSCIEVCDTLWLFWSNMSRARCVGVGWGGWGGAG